MLIDTHCHLNMIVKTSFDTPLSDEECQRAQFFVDQAFNSDVKRIINIGTSLTESLNCIKLASLFNSNFAVVGLHPNDCTETWRDDLKKIRELVRDAKKNKIIGIGECGLDKYYSDYNINRQKDAFRAQIELALEYNLAIVVHTRDAGDEVLRILEEYKNNNIRGVIHCFSENISFARDAIKLNFVLGIGGIITYPKNNHLREVISAVELKHIILETDAPFLPPQQFRGKQNQPAYIKIIAEYIAQLRNQSFQEIAKTTTITAEKLFLLNN